MTLSKLGLSTGITAISLSLGAFAVSASNATYPVAQLDNCRDTQECQLYCEIPANKPACWSYSQFQPDNQVLGEATASGLRTVPPAISFPIVQLGNCATAAACRAYCELPENHVACVEFSRQRGLNNAAQEYSLLLAKAKTELGCDSLPACHSLCGQAANHDKCLAFTTKFAPPKIKDTVSRALTLLTAIEQAFGCTSTQSCSQYCKTPEHRDQCRQFLQSFEEHTATASGTLMELRTKLKADCNSPDDCRKWCGQHPNLCPGFSTQIIPTRYPHPTEVGQGFPEPTRVYPSVFPLETGITPNR